MELNKAVLDCMQALRRRLRSELAVDIRLSQPDAIEAMLVACLRSSDMETRALGQRLAQFLDGQDNLPTATPTVKATVEVVRPLAPLGSQARGSVRMYRGQRVYA
ncbi:MAG TPA: hypothetical protein VJA19_22310 [Pseudomonas sp.]|nr:hypothetical protein [Pseudomonas sp.]